MKNLQTLFLLLLLLLPFSTILNAQIAGEDQTVCLRRAELNAEPLTGEETGKWTSLDKDITFDDPLNPNTIVRLLKKGENILTWTVSPTGISDDVIITNEAVNVDFSVEKDNLKVYFFGSSPNGTAWYWDFDDGHFSEEKNPTNTYNERGTYNVTLTSENEYCSDYITKKIGVGSSFVKARFTYEQEGETKISFEDISTSYQSKIIEWCWNFGDGSIFYGKNPPAHIYSKDGLYEVSLHVTDDKENEDERCKVVKVGNPNCDMVPYFSFYSSSSSLETYFKDESEGVITNWYWDFGDGNTSIEQSPMNKYEEAGEYSVIFSIYNSENDCFTTYETEVTVGNQTCKADFSYKKDPTNLTVTFENKSIGENLIHFWEFEDGGTSTEINPIYKFDEAGIYDVWLTITNPDESCMDFIEKTIQVGEVDCNADFDAFIDTENNIAHFTNKSIGNATEFNWYFGDGSYSEEENPSYKFSNPGYYPVELYIFGGECMDYKEKYLLVAGEGNDCQANFMYQVNAKTQTVLFVDQSMGDNLTYIWDFDDGNTSTEKNPTYKFTEQGYYNVCLTINDNGITNTICKPVVVSTQEQCLAKFMYMTNHTDKKVTFKDASTGSPDYWYWEFDDGTTSEEQNPTKKYTEAGYYMVYLYTKNSRTETESEYVNIVNVGKGNEGLIASFRYKVGTPQRESYPTDFVGAAFGTSSKLSWDFDTQKGETNTTSLTPTYTYKAPGKYNVCFTVSDPITGNSNKFCKDVIIGNSSSKDFYLENNIHIYSKDGKIVIITKDLLLASDQIKIYNMVGKEIKSEVKNRGNSFAMEVNTSGIYLVKIVKDNKIFTRKVFVN